MEKVTPRLCLVTGATGVVGTPLVKDLLSRGHHVRVLVRDEQLSRGHFGGEVEWAVGDIRDERVQGQAVKNADWVIHLAAKLHINDPGPEAREEYESVNVEATRKLLAAATSQRVSRFIFFSTINVYGPGDGNRVFDENSKLNPVGIYAEGKAAAENLVTAASDDTGEKIGVVLRPAAVYGSRMKGNYVRLAKAIKRGRFAFVGNGDNRRTLVHQADLVAATVLAAERAPGGSIYNVTDGAVHSFRQIVESISEVLGKKKPRLRIPVGPVRFAAAAAENMANAVGLRSPVNRGLIDKILEDIAVDGGRIQRETGFRPQYDLARGWREALVEKL